MLKATVLADSVNSANGRRVTTFLLTYPRFIHAELLTHRVFSRNSASSRAIPVRKQLAAVWCDPAVPLRWGRTGKGMQDAGPLPPGRAALCRRLWLAARYPALLAAWLLVRLGLHKQVANRLLEPWAWMTVVLTGTEWVNFYRLRYHKDAQPEFQALAGAMLRAHAASTPRRLSPGEWHTPFGDAVPEVACGEFMEESRPPTREEVLKVATARSARASYVNFYGKNDPYDDFRLHDALIRSVHMSPFEHCCRAEADDAFRGNLRGYTPYRKLLAGESGDDGRPFDPAALLAELSTTGA